MDTIEVEIVKVISEHKRRWRRASVNGISNMPPAPGFKRVMAIVKIDGRKVTRHCDTRDGKTCFARI